MKSIALASLATIAGVTLTGILHGAPVTYVLDSHHTYPSFEADHMGGLSVWRGKFTDTSGKVVYDKDARAGTIDIVVQMKSIDFGMAKLDERAKAPEIFDVEKYPTATFIGKFSQFDGATPIEAQGTFTLHGVSKPLTLKIVSFMCKTNPVSKKEVCGADATAVFDRSEYGINFGESGGFKMGVKLQIQVEGSPDA
jgi:polyisoprenoid-binding protein YceI